jgi:hypothetical protein
MKRSKTFRRRLQALAIAAKRKAALERAEAYRVHIEWALNHAGRFGRPISFRAAAGKLNERQLPIIYGWPLDFDECVQHGGTAGVT